uniref:Caveolin n=1 Tax=Ditylenchus dipsaci TaxID=166011 RepID=A0A915E6X1_9BILA
MTSETANTTGLELSEQTPSSQTLTPPWWWAQRAQLKEQGGKGGKPEEGSAVVAPTKDVETGNNDTNNTTPKNKKTYWWQRKPCHTGDQQHGQDNQQLSYGVNLVQRDDNGLQQAIDMDYGHIYGEPDSVHSLNGIWRANAHVFQSVRSFFYKLFSLIIAILLLSSLVCFLRWFPL